MWFLRMVWVFKYYPYRIQIWMMIIDVLQVKTQTPIIYWKPEIEYGSEQDNVTNTDLLLETNYIGPSNSTEGDKTQIILYVST